MQPTAAKLENGGQIHFETSFFGVNSYSLGEAFVGSSVGLPIISLHIHSLQDYFSQFTL